LKNVRVFYSFVSFFIQHLLSDPWRDDPEYDSDEEENIEEEKAW
jgi:hypothetical protein